MQHTIIMPAGAPVQGLPPLPAVIDSREAIEAAIEAFIAMLDAIDGDADCEPDGDELDGNHSEDDWMNFNAYDRGPGCPISDAGGDPLDRGELDEAEAGHCVPYGVDQTKLSTPAGNPWPMPSARDW